MNYTIDEKLDTMVRDFSSPFKPFAKSEVRRRINEYAVEAYRAGQKKAILDLLATTDKLPVNLGMPKHLLLIDLHNYAKNQNIELLP
jgi:hypothetical protein